MPRFTLPSHVSPHDGSDLRLPPGENVAGLETLAGWSLELFRLTGGREHLEDDHAHFGNAQTAPRCRV